MNFQIIKTYHRIYQTKNNFAVKYLTIKRKNRQNGGFLYKEKNFSALQPDENRRISEAHVFDFIVDT